MRTLLLAPLLFAIACLPRPPGPNYDGDGDGHSPPEDCDDTDASVFPGATEIFYDGVDQDCDGASDYDQDGDGYDSDAHGGDDCDDGDDGVHPGAGDAYYDGVDQNCDGASDYDQDGDGYDSDGFGGDDCNDTNADIHPGATEQWYDDIDQDCDAGDDYDQDGDGHRSDEHGGDDCDDTRPDVNPSMNEALDDVDNDCDGQTDEVPWMGGPQVVSAYHQGLHGEPNGFDGFGYAIANRAQDAVGPGNLGGGSLDPSSLVRDGLPDLLISAPLTAWLSYASSAPAAVYLVPGDRADALELPDVSDRTVLRLEPGDTSTFFGASVDWLDSIDGDDVAEIVVGSPAFTDLGFGVGEAFLFLSDDWDEAATTTSDGGQTLRTLSSDDASIAFLAASTGDGFGNIIGLGDYDTNGGGELAVTAPWYQPKGGRTPEWGRIEIFSGTELALARGQVLSFGDGQVALVGDDDHEHLGLAAPVVADLNNDGRKDLVASCPLTTDGYGLLVASLGGSGATGVFLATDADLQLQGATGAYEVGLSLAAGGDLDGDGSSDLLVQGASSAGDPVLWVISGSAWVDEGAETVPSAAILRIEGAEASLLSDKVAFSLRGDFNGDRRVDLVVAASADEPETNGGLVSVFFGRPDLVGTIRADEGDAQLNGPQGSWLGYSAIGAEDLDQDGFTELLLGAAGTDPSGVLGLHRPGALFVLDSDTGW